MLLDICSCSIDVVCVLVSRVGAGGGVSGGGIMNRLWCVWSVVVLSK